MSARGHRKPPESMEGYSAIPLSKQRLGYKGAQYMSTSTFETMAEEIRRQREQATRMTRSMSVGPGTWPSSMDPVVTGGRRALYGSLPFVAAFGMQSRETTVRKVLLTSSSSVLHLSEAQVRYADLRTTLLR